MFYTKVNSPLRVKGTRLYRLTYIPYLDVVYDQNHYFGFSPIPNWQKLLANTVIDTEATF